MCVDIWILEGVWIQGYCRVCGYCDTARRVDTGIFQGVCVLGYYKVCG